MRKKDRSDQCLCFRCTDRTIPLLVKSKISSLNPSSVIVLPSVWQAGSWSEIVFFMQAQMAVNSSCFGISCLFVLRLNVPVNNFSVMSGRSQPFLGLTSTVDVPCSRTQHGAACGD